VFHNSSDLLLLIIQIFCGFAIYIGLMMVAQKALLTEIKNLIFGRESSVTNLKIFEK
jgi:hypothetical protein